MKNMDLLMASLEYIELHIKDDLKTAEVAEKCFCSKSTLEKLFRHVNNISVQDYIKHRRMMLAAKVISAEPDKNILDIALEYGYSSNEAFARAFKEIWNVNPSEFRGKRYFELYPKLRKPLNEGNRYVMERKNVDISELYDLFKARQECYFICLDIKLLGEINEISEKAGDLAIIETMKRMDNIAGINDMIFRIGGDEFCILTDSTQEEYAEELVQKLLAMNGKTFAYLEQEIPLALRVTSTKVTQTVVRYNELFEKLHIAINELRAP